MSLDHPNPRLSDVLDLPPVFVRESATSAWTPRRPARRTPSPGTRRCAGTALPGGVPHRDHWSPAACVLWPVFAFFALLVCCSCGLCSLSSAARLGQDVLGCFFCFPRHLAVSRTRSAWHRARAAVWARLAPGSQVRASGSSEPHPSYHTRHSAAGPGGP